MTTAEVSPSLSWRKKGNKIYCSLSEGLCSVVKKYRLKECISCYYSAFNLSDCDEEKASAAKNLAISSWKMAKAEAENMEKASLLLHYYKESFKYFSIAYVTGQGIKPPNWSEGIHDWIKSCWEEFTSSYLQLLDLDKRLCVYYDVIQCIDIADIRAEWYLEIARCHFHAGVIALQTKDYKKALYQMKECHMPIHEAMAKGVTSDDLISDCHILEDDVNMHLFMAESLQAMHTGDNLYTHLLKEEETLNMDLVWEVVDWYKEAVLRTREVTEVELEAIALSRLGRMFDKILKIKSKAKEYVMKSVELANSMHPRTFHSEDWFKDCLEIIERYQKEVVEQETDKWNKNRQDVLAEMTKEMSFLEKNDQALKDDLDFLKFLYKNFPPKNPNHTLDSIPEMKEENPRNKKLLFSAIIHYHPDRNSDHGKKWKVTAEEITKILTQRYEVIKSQN